jgi:hypothetical protein
MFKLTKNSMPFFNQFNFKRLESMNTHDGVAYSCQLFFNDQKIADVENGGTGGETMIYYAPGGEELLNSIAPKIKSFYDMTDITWEIDNEYIISDLVEVKLQMKDILKGQSKAILFITKDNKIMQVQFKAPFSKFKAAGKFDIVQNKAKELEKEGNFILNTNLG